MGGIDRWAIEEAMLACIPYKEFAPKLPQWGGPDGFMARNLQIADASDVLANIVCDRYPPGFPDSKKFPICYHCKTNTHIKSGGCWTMKQAAKRGNNTRLIVVENHYYEWA
jgi:hypothetical protein